MAVRCETRSDLEAYGIAIVILSNVLLVFAVGAVMAARDGESPDVEDFAFFALFGAGYVALVAWVALRIREWQTLGDARLHLSPARPKVGEPFTCRMQFARPPAEQGTARAELICQVTTHSGIGKKKSRTRELWRDAQTTPTIALLQFAFHPPENLPHAEKSMSTEVRWWLRVRSQGFNGFRRRFRMPLGPKGSMPQDSARAMFETEFAASAAAPAPITAPSGAFKVIYTLCAILFLAIAGVIAWGFADHLQIGPDVAQLQGKLRLGDLRQSSTSDFAAQLDGNYTWQRGRLSVQADSLRLRAWDCEGACPRVKELSLILWHFGMDEQGGVGGTSVARSEPVTIDKVPQEGVALDLGAQSFALRVTKNPDPRQTALMLEVRTEKTDHSYGQRFGGASHLLGLVQIPGDPETCAKVKRAVEALEHFCHERFSKMLLEMELAEKQRLLFLAVSRGNLEAVKALLRAEAPIDPVNSRGDTPLMVAVFADQPEIAAALLEAGANPNFVANPSSEYGSDTPLGAALTAGALRSAQVLLGKGADPNTTHGGSPIVHVAVAADLPEALAPLAKRGADVNVRAAWGNQPTPLMAAAGSGKLQVVNTLLELGADPAAGDSNGNTARDYAATHKRREVLERLKSFPGKCPLTGC
jgi:ankyrin repeat protein